ncbi:MAG: DUF262 domain-containing protein [Raineya sp.]|jgi:hypothetical protein|nr:DUF262 domain-containing protein [Raineya sp.]
MTTNIDEKNTSDVEEIDEVSIIEAPFDPNLIQVSSQPLTIGDIIDRLEHNEIKLDTEFQRLPDLWNNTKKSRFIESLLLKLPIPTFYFDAQDDNLWRVIDGLQRISTIKSFIIDKKLVLQDLEFLKQYKDHTFEMLPRDLQRRIKTFPITIYILGKGTPDVVKYNIFSRINQGGLVLKPQEIRHALHQGIGSDLVADLVRAISEMDEAGNIKKTATETGKMFVKVTEGKINPLRMEDRDFATRFLAFYLIPYQDYLPDLDSFMNKGMAKIKELTQEQIDKLKNDFYKALFTAYEIFGNDAFRKRYRLEDSRKPINKALFEVLTVNFAKLTQEERDLLIANKDIFKSKLRELHQPENRFLRSISQGTAQKETVEYRFEQIEKIIQETLHYDK